MPTTSNFGWTTPADTDLVKDGAAAIRTLGNGIDTSFLDLKGGTTGQVLSKNSNTDLDYTWVTPNVGDITEVQAGTGISVASGTGPIPVVTNTVATAFDAAGDLVYGTGADTFTKLSLGTANQVLAVNSGATAPEWKTVASGGKLLQVITAVSSGYIAITGNNVYADANLSATITPSSASSRILVLVTQGFGSYQNATSASNDAYAKILRGATTIWQSDATSSNGVTWTSKAYAETSWTTITLHYVDSPSSTSALTYKTQWKQSDNANDHTLYMNYGTYPSQITLFEIGA